MNKINITEVQYKKYKRREVQLKRAKELSRELWLAILDKQELKVIKRIVKELENHLRKLEV